jgi:hypothetical protein
VLVYLGNHDVAEAERSCMELDQHLIVGELGKRLLGVKLEVIEAALAHDSPAFCRFRQRHRRCNKLVVDCKYVKRLYLVIA